MSEPVFSTIQFSVSDGIATLTLNRPDRINSFNQTMHQEVQTALSQVQQDSSIRCLLLLGNGRGFCAGQDLGEKLPRNADGKPDYGNVVEVSYNRLIRTLTRLPIPVLCAVQGVAAGAGANIALACDIVIAGRSAYFTQAFCKIGLIPDSGGTWLLPRLVGHARAMGLMLLGDKVSAEQAVQWGMIWQCVDDEVLLETAQQLAKQLASQATRSLGYTKQALYAASTNTLDQQLDLERDLQRVAGWTVDHQEGVRAFLEKRAAEFKGK